MHVADCILAKTGGPTRNEGLLSHYQSGGATSDTLADAERQFLIAQGATAGPLHDMWVEFISAQVGAPSTKNLTDLWHWYWCSFVP